MRTISAHYAWDPSMGFVKNPLLGINNQHEVVRFESMGNTYKEYPHVEFFGGLIIPSFLNVIDVRTFISSEEINKRIDRARSIGSLYSVIISSNEAITGMFSGMSGIFVHDGMEINVQHIENDPWKHLCEDLLANSDIDSLLKQYLFKPWKNWHLTNTGGSFSIGSRPGALLLNGIDWKLMKFMAVPQLRIIHKPY